MAQESLSNTVPKVITAICTGPHEYTFKPLFCLDLSDTYEQPDCLKGGKQIQIICFNLMYVLALHNDTRDTREREKECQLFVYAVVVENKLR